MKSSIVYFLFKLLIVKVFIIVQVFSFYPVPVMAQFQKKSVQISNFDSKIQKIESIYNAANTISHFLKNLNLETTTETFLLEKLKSANSENSKLPSLKVTKLKYSTLLTFDKKHTLEIKKSDQSILINGQSLQVKDWKNISQTYDTIEAIIKKSEYSLFNLLVPKANALVYEAFVVVMAGSIVYIANDQEARALVRDKIKSIFAGDKEKNIKILKIKCNGSNLEKLAIEHYRMAPSNDTSEFIKTEDFIKIDNDFFRQQGATTVKVTFDKTLSSIEKSLKSVQSDTCAKNLDDYQFNQQQEMLLRAFVEKNIKAGSFDGQSSKIQIDDQNN